ncbi:hypothetical protein MJN47_17550, partial [Salmonella enterica subsp. enterica serovar Lubbock]|nr:hypothetical protein [Salmonella enterica subsp. enterica serovar Lubbock]
SGVIVRHQGTAGNYLMPFTMEKVEKRLTDLSGALAHNYPEIKLHFILQAASALAASFPVTRSRGSLAALMRLE